MPFFKTLKRSARLALKNNWGRATRATFFIIGIIAALSALQTAAFIFFIERGDRISHTIEPPGGGHGQFIYELFRSHWAGLVVMIFFTLAALFFLSPILLGARRFCCRLVWQGAAAFSDLFYFFDNFRRYMRAVWFAAQLCFRALFWGIALFAFPIGVLGISISFLQIDTLERSSRAAASVGVVLAAGLFVLAAVLYSILIQRYALCGYLLCGREDLTANGAISKSIHYTKGKRGMLLLFTLSFLPLNLLVLSTFGLALIFVMPYRIVAETLLYRYLAEQNSPACQLSIDS